MRSRLSKLSTLLGLGAAMAIAAPPAAARWHSQENAESRGGVPSIHASVALAAPVTDRATDNAPAQRRAPSASSAALAGHFAGTPAQSAAIARGRLPFDRLVATRLAARGYDATAPPLS